MKPLGYNIIYIRFDLFDFIKGFLYKKTSQLQLAWSTMSNNVLANAGITLDEGRDSKKKMNGWQLFVSEKLEELTMDFGEASTHLKQQWRGMTTEERTA